MIALGSLSLIQKLGSKSEILFVQKYIRNYFADFLDKNQVYKKQIVAVFFSIILLSGVTGAFSSNSAYVAIEKTPYEIMNISIINSAYCPCFISH